MVIGSTFRDRERAGYWPRARVAFLAGVLASHLTFVPDRSAQPATFTLQTTNIPGLEPKKAIAIHFVRMTGVIEPRDAEKLRGILATLRSSTIRTAARPLATLELSSVGGDLLEGIKIGLLMREFEVAALVRKGDTCLSACALAFLGGTMENHPLVTVPDRRIESGGRVGFHNFNTDPKAVASAAQGDANMVARGFGLARAASATLFRYAADMGIDINFMAAILTRPPDQWQYVETVGDFLDVGACLVGTLPPPGPPERQAVNICNHATGWSAAADPSQARPMSTADSRRQLLAQVRANVGTLKVPGPLAAQIEALVTSRDQRLVEVVYADLRAAGIPLPEHFGRTFIVDGYASGTLTLHCHISLSTTIPEKFDLVLVEPAALLKSFSPPPAACPGLFRYDREELLNPRR